jgi:alpha-D-xyloside xylohydrolase
VSYGYEKGAFTRIPLHWNDASKSLTIGARQGSFPGMLKERTFEIVFVNKDHSIGFSFDPKPDKVVKYNGEALDVRLD